jgi:hypothetical protein
MSSEPPQQWKPPPTLVVALARLLRQAAAREAQSRPKVGTERSPKESQKIEG